MVYVQYVSVKETARALSSVVWVANNHLRGKDRISSSVILVAMMVDEITHGGTVWQ